MTSIVPHLVAFAIATSPPAPDAGAEPPPVGAEVPAAHRKSAVSGRHAAAAHAQLVDRVRRKVAPNLRAYRALAQRILDALAFSEEVAPTARQIDEYRNSLVARSLESTVTGVRWLTQAWDALKDLVDHTEEVKVHLSAVRAASAELDRVARLYVERPSADRLRALILGFQDSGPQLSAAARVFAQVAGCLGTTKGILDKSCSVLKPARRLPWIGSYARKLTAKVTALADRLDAARALLLVAEQAMGRDHREVSAIAAVLDEAEAHDAFDAADALGTAGRPGSALASFHQIRTRWPDTAWAHRSDRKVVEAVGYIDRMEARMAKLQSRVQVLEQQLESSRPAAEPPAEAEREVDLSAGAPPPTPAGVPLWLFVSALVAVGAIATVHAVRVRQGARAAGLRAQA